MEFVVGNGFCVCWLVECGVWVLVMDGVVNMVERVKVCGIFGDSIEFRRVDVIFDEEFEVFL